MAPRRKPKRTLKPRLPARVRTKKRKSKTKNAQHPELIGLGLLALGIFLSSVLYLGWSGGMAGGWIVDGFTATIGAAAYVAPIAFLVVGALMVARSSIVDVKPFRTGLAVTTFGLLAALGASHGGATGRGLEGIFGLLVGSDRHDDRRRARARDRSTAPLGRLRGRARTPFGACGATCTRSCPARAA